MTPVIIIYNSGLQADKNLCTLLWEKLFSCTPIFAASGIKT